MKGESFIFFSSAGEIATMEESDVRDYFVFLITLTIWVSHFLLITSFVFAFFWLQKATAVKKAYAEMILNTAKESAARVMVSNRKKLGFITIFAELKMKLFVYLSD